MTARFNSVIKILVLWVRSEPFGSAEKLTRIVFWILKKINHEITKLEKHENRVGLFRDFKLSRFRDKRSCPFPVYPGWM